MEGVAWLWLRKITQIDDNRMMQSQRTLADGSGIFVRCCDSQISHTGLSISSGVDAGLQMPCIAILRRCSRSDFGVWVGSKVLLVCSGCCTTTWKREPRPLAQRLAPATTGRQILQKVWYRVVVEERWQFGRVNQDPALRRGDDVKSLYGRLDLACDWRAGMAAYFLPSRRSWT
ncbi:hypothetical protein K461DRAFT_18460 [Myriangium duriaei CBS 260.36]|uniref:Uncharacterized protein n=1 Tax=Myriangium duriaei CBS 260.36 TaxID=1168546 RepID=A0A9P4J9I1_9PEZI|nr:hypothetical protein K461DRAFT_18460 [Myriangium duriaei CBS 260.36]